MVLLALLALLVPQAYPGRRALPELPLGLPDPLALQGTLDLKGLPELPLALRGLLGPQACLVLKALRAQLALLVPLVLRVQPALSVQQRRLRKFLKTEFDYQKGPACLF